MPALTFFLAFVAVLALIGDMVITGGGAVCPKARMAREMLRPAKREDAASRRWDRIVIVS